MEEVMENFVMFKELIPNIILAVIVMLILLRSTKIHTLQARIDLLEELENEEIENQRRRRM
jgi:hypothetical protein